MNSAKERLLNGLLKENPTFVLMLGMCPTLAVTTSAMNGLGMGLTTMVVLALSNVMISLLRNIIPDKVRIPAFIVVIASFVTIVELLLEGFIPSLYDALGIYIPLIVVNCIILGRAESYASKNGVFDSLIDALGMGVGFTFALVVIAFFREVIGTGGIAIGEYFPFLPKVAFRPLSKFAISLFVDSAGGFLVLGMVLAFLAWRKNKKEAIEKKKAIEAKKAQLAQKVKEA